MNSWLLAARIKTLPAAISPVILGTALSFHDGFFNLVIFLMTIFAAILIQVGTNFANDLFDFQKGADREDRLGPPRVIQLGLISKEKMKIAKIFIESLIFSAEEPLTKESMRKMLSYYGDFNLDLILRELKNDYKNNNYDLIID